VLWKKMREMHEENPYHIMIHGGDQVYSDSPYPYIWELDIFNKDGKNFFKLRDENWPWDEAALEKMRDFYFDLYYNKFGRGDSEKLFAEVPGIMVVFIFLCVLCLSNDFFKRYGMIMIFSMVGVPTFPSLVRAPFVKGFFRRQKSAIRSSSLA